MNTPPVSSVNPVNAIITVADPKQETSARLANIAIGQEVQGKVLSKLSDGTHLVDIQNTQARIELPANVNSGDTLLMTLVRNEPRPTFLLTQNLNGNTSNQGSSLLNQQTGVTTTLSDAAKLIESLTQNNKGQSAATLSNTNPLIQANQPIQANTINTALQNVLQFSGLFYEAHVAQWALGKRSLEDLQKEPQSHFNKTSAPILQLKNAADTEQGQLIQSQLSTLEQQKFVWQGEVWPGQNMHWEIERRQDQADEDGNTESQQESQWQSTATFSFENLGNVSAKLHLTGNQLMIYIDTDSAASKNAMIENQMTLQQNLENAGINLKQLLVDADDEKR